jgi:hypothetical protein
VGCRAQLVPILVYLTAHLFFSTYYGPFGSRAIEGAGSIVQWKQPTRRHALAHCLAAAITAGAGAQFWRERSPRTPYLPQLRAPDSSKAPRQRITLPRSEQVSHPLVKRHPPPPAPMALPYLEAVLCKSLSPRRSFHGGVPARSGRFLGFG